MKNTWKVILLVILLALPALACGGTQSGGGSNTRGSTAPTATQGEAAVEVPADTPVPEPPAEELTVGSTGELGEFRITLNELRRSPGEVIKAKEGHEYLILNITVENISDKEQTFSTMLCCSVKDDTGQKYSITFTDNTQASPDGTVLAGDKNRGEIAFEVPTTATGLMFIYQQPFGNQQLRFKLDK